MKLSIIIPAKNEAKYIGDCIDYFKIAIEKWGGDAEIILVDNRSKGSTTIISKKKLAKLL